MERASPIPSQSTGSPAPRRHLRRLGPVLCLMLLAAAGPQGASAQSLLSVELSPRAVMPVSTFGDQGAENAFGLTGIVLLRVFSPLSIYGGWDRTSFDCGPCSGNGSLDVSGPYGGLEAQLATDRRLRPWFRAGFGRRMTESDISTATIETDENWAIHLAMGLQFEIQDRVSVTGGARFETLDPSVDLGSDVTDLGTPVSFVSLDLGLRLNIIP